MGKKNPNSSSSPGFDVNVCGRFQVTLSGFSPKLEISVSPVLSILESTCFSVWNFNPSSRVDAWGADLVLWKPADADLVLSCQDLNFTHLPFLLGELDSAPVNALMWC